MRPGALVPSKWRLPECIRRILPDAVTLKRFAAPRWVFNFFLGFEAFLGIGKTFLAWEQCPGSLKFSASLRSCQDATAGRASPALQDVLFRSGPGRGTPRPPRKAVATKATAENHYELTTRPPKKLLCLLGRLGYRLGYGDTFFRSQQRDQNVA